MERRRQHLQTEPPLQRDFGDFRDRERTELVGEVEEEEGEGIAVTDINMDFNAQLSPELSEEDHMLGIDNVGLDFAELDLIISGESMCLPDSPPDSSSDGCLTSPQYDPGHFESGAGFPGSMITGYQDPPLYSHSQFPLRHPSLHDRSPEVAFCQPREEQAPVNFSNKALAKVDYSQPHQLVAEAQQSHQRVQTGAVPTRLTVRGVTNNNMAFTEQQQARQTALSPREAPSTSNRESSLDNSIKQEPLPSPPATVPVPVPGPPVKKRRRDEINAALVVEDLKEVTELTAGATVKLEAADGGDGQQQMVRFVSFQPHKWSQTFTSNRVKLPTPVLKVSADKGFNFSNLDDAFIAQKKNHFQLTCHVVKEGEHQLVSTEAGFRQIEHLQLNFYGVKSEAQEQRIQIEQSQTDRSRKRFFPIKLAFRGDQPMRVSIGRLHFSETTLNNMRKKGRPNPEQRFFQLVVALEAVVLGPNNTKVEVPLFCLATERIIVRASNPGLFEPEQEASWSKQGGSDTVYHMGKVGIGTEHSTEALTVQGNIQVTGELLHPSDRRIKAAIAPVSGNQQLKNIQNVQVVEYQYKPEYLARFTAGEREKMEKRQTGVIAQDLKRIIPDAVESAGDVKLPGAGQVEDMLIVNKDRLFLENVGAVRELSKVTDNLGHRIEELESHTVRMTRLSGSVKSSAGSLSTNSSICRRSGKRRSATGDGSVFRSRWVQGAILALVSIMTLCLVAMATLYILQYVQKVEDFPVFPEGNTSVTTSSTLPPRISRTTRRTSMMTTVRASVSTARLATVRTPKVTSSTSTLLPLFSSTTTSRTSRIFPTIGKPHDCNAPDAERACNTFCCIPPLPPVHNGIASGTDFSNSRSAQASNTPFPDNQLSGEFSSARLSIDDNTISSLGPQAVRREETSSSREALIAENLVEGSRVASVSSEVVSSSSREDLTADNLVGDGTIVEADNLVGAEVEEEEEEEEMEADQPESRRVMREEEVTSERDQTVLNLIDGVKTGEEEAAPGEEEPGRIDQFVASLLAGQHKPGLPGSNLELEGDEASGLSEVRSPLPSEEKGSHEGLREGGVGEQEPRIGREERERGRKKEVSRSNQIERESGGKEEKEEPAAEQEASSNSTSEEEEETWLAGGRKSSKSVASSSFSNSVLGGAEKDSLGLLENHLLKGGQEKRRRRSTVGHEENEDSRAPRDFEIREGEAGCALGPTVQVATGVGRTDLSLTYCTGCSSHQGHNCSYTVPLSAHMPDPNISLLVPVSAVLCPSARPINEVCPAVNDIAGQEEVEEDVGGTVPPNLPSGLRVHLVEVRTHSWVRLTFRLPTNNNNGVTSICLLPRSDVGKVFTEIDIEVKRICSE